MSEEVVFALLPKSFRHVIEEVESADGPQPAFRATVRCNFSSETFSQWLHEFQLLSRTTWIVQKTFPSCERLSMRKDFMCHLSSRNKSTASASCQRSKDKQCTASMSVKVKLVTRDTVKKDKLLRDGLAGIVKLNFCHSHANTAQILSLRPPSGKLVQELHDCFDEGLGPVAACNVVRHRVELDSQSDMGDLADGAVNPRQRVAYHQHDRWRKDNLGGRSVASSLVMLQDKLPIYSEAGHCVRIREEPFAVAIVTEVMARAHSLSSSADMCFVDSTAACDAENNVITFFLAPGICGAVPLAVLITNSTSTSAYTAGFGLVREAVGNQSFGMQGFPSIIMTDDCDAERSALADTWPASLLLLCHFHVAQAVWRWLWEAKHRISAEDRKPLMLQFRSIMYAATEADAIQKYDAAVRSPEAQRYSTYQVYLGSQWERRQLWCVAYRRVAALRGNNTNNIAEVTVRLYKDKVLSRCKAYNAVALVDFTVTALEAYYKNRLLDFAHSRIAAPHLLLADLEKKSAYVLSKEAIVSTGPGTYLVPSADDASSQYEVDVVGGICSCVAGMCGKCCKHQMAVHRLFGHALPNMPAVTTNDRYHAAVLALGDAVAPFEFYSRGNSAEPSTAVLAQARREPDPMLTDSSVTVNTEAVATASPAAETAALCDRVCSLLQTKVALLSPHGDTSLQAGLQKFLTRLENVQSQSQMATFLHTAGAATARYKTGAAIRVQPTAIARRRPGLTRGSRCVAAGRPAKVPTVAACPKAASKRKRPRSLAYNIGHNQPNAKSHGSGH